MTHLVSDNQPSFLVLPLLDQYFVSEDYEQQRKDLLKKHGIDLADPNGIADGRKTKRLAPKEIEQIMGGEEGEGGIFTWREKNRKKVCPPFPPFQAPTHLAYYYSVGILSVW